MLEYGTNLVAGVTPVKVDNLFKAPVPIFNTVAHAVGETGANASVIYVPPSFADDAILEAIAAGVELIVAITEGIPVMDMIKVREALNASRSRLIGPNCPGIISPGKCKIRYHAGACSLLGRVGILSRSGTLTYKRLDS